MRVQSRIHVRFCWLMKRAKKKKKRWEKFSSTKLYTELYLPVLAIQFDMYSCCRFDIGSNECGGGCKRLSKTGYSISMDHVFLEAMGFLRPSRNVWPHSISYFTKKCETIWANCVAVLFSKWNCSNHVLRTDRRMELAKALLNLLIYMADLYDFIWQCLYLSGVFTNGSKLKKKNVYNN